MAEAASLKLSVVSFVEKSMVVGPSQVEEATEGEVIGTSVFKATDKKSLNDVLFEFNERNDASIKFFFLSQIVDVVVVKAAKSNAGGVGELVKDVVIFVLIPLNKLGIDTITVEFVVEGLFIVKNWELF